MKVILILILIHEYTYIQVVVCRVYLDVETTKLIVTVKFQLELFTHSNLFLFLSLLNHFPIPHSQHVCRTHYDCDCRFATSLTHARDLAVVTSDNSLPKSLIVPSSSVKLPSRYFQVFPPEFFHP